MFNRNYLIFKNFLTAIIISLSYCCEKMIGMKFNEISLPEKEYFYSHFSMEDITDADYAHAKRVLK